jgi:hypothetical protein
MVAAGAWRVWRSQVAAILAHLHQAGLRQPFLPPFFQTQFKGLYSVGKQHCKTNKFQKNDPQKV